MTLQLGPSAAPPLVAVVDDDASFLRSVARLLRTAGYRVAAYRSARELLASIDAISPECLVLDVHMPEMNGLVLFDCLTTRGYRVPVLFMTAYDTPQTRAYADRAGSVGLLLKPFDRQALLQAIERAASRHAPPTPP